MWACLATTLGLVVAVITQSAFTGDVANRVVTDGLVTMVGSPDGGGVLGQTVETVIAIANLYPTDKFGFVAEVTKLRAIVFKREYFTVVLRFKGAP